MNARPACLLVHTLTRPRCPTTPAKASAAPKHAGAPTVLILGYKASAEQFGPRRLLDFSVLAEKVGFDSVFISDHFQPWKHTDGHAPSALAWLRAPRAAAHRPALR